MRKLQANTSGDTNLDAFAYGRCRIWRAPRLGTGLQYTANSRSSTTRAETSHGREASSKPVMLTDACGCERSTGIKQSEQGTVLPPDGYADVSVEVIAASAYSLHSEPQKSVTSSSSDTMTTASGWPPVTV
jgi:hypothetical protein